MKCGNLLFRRQTTKGNCANKILMCLSCGIKNTSGQFFIEKVKKVLENKNLCPIFAPVRRFRNN